MFFGGLLSSCKLQLTEPRPADYGKVDGFCDLVGPGMETVRRFQIESTTPIICISKPGDDPATIAKGPFVIMQELLNTLLHEQLHAIFGLHTCSCDNGCREKINYGMVYHVVEWLAAALAIERAATKLLGWPVCMARDRCLTSDIHFFGYRMPNEVMLRALDLDLEYIFQNLKWYRLETNMDAKEKREHLPLKKNRCLRDTWTVDNWENGFQSNEWLLR